MNSAAKLFGQLKVRLICLVKDHQWTHYEQRHGTTDYMLYCGRCRKPYPFKLIPQWLTTEMKGTQ